jgi:hypothetical protein
VVSREWQESTAYSSSALYFFFGFGAVLCAPPPTPCKLDRPAAPRTLSGHHCAHILSHARMCGPILVGGQHAVDLSPEDPLVIAFLPLTQLVQYLLLRGVQRQKI